MTAAHPTRATEAFFGRRHGKTLRPLPAAALARLDRYRLDLTAPAGDLFAGAVDGIRLEIGFGAGEHLLAEARRLPGIGFIGVEPFVNGMARLLLDLGDKHQANLRLHDDDATRLLDWLPAAAIDQVDLLYPDPWPKKRHWKRRFVNPRNLERFARVLRQGGRFRFASDVPDYVLWTREHLAASPQFEDSGRDVTLPYEAWPGTRYEAKAIRAGRVPAYLEYRRR